MTINESAKILSLPLKLIKKRFELLQKFPKIDFTYTASVNKPVKYMNKILIVDDDKDMLTVVELLLTAHNYTVETVFNPANILEKVKSFNPDIILMDVNMGQHDGREICKLVKSDTLIKHIPVILFSALQNLQGKHIECEAIDFIAKPFDALDLIRIIKKHLLAA